MKYLLVIAICSACTVQPRDYTGATIQMQLTNNGFRSIQDDTPMPSFTLDSEPEYSIDIHVFTYEGTASENGKTTYPNVTSVSTTFALGGMALPSPEYMSDGSVISADFRSKSPLVIPASALGGVLTLHASGRDEEGLSSNIIDMQIELK